MVFMSDREIYNVKFVISLALSCNMGINFKAVTSSSKFNDAFFFRSKVTTLKSSLLLNWINMDIKPSTRKKLQRLVYKYVTSQMCGWQICLMFFITSPSCVVGLS